MGKEFGQEVLDGLEELAKLQEIRNVGHKLRGDEYFMRNPLVFAKEAVKHFYGLETDNLLIDLHFEGQHLENFYNHLVEHSHGEDAMELSEIRLAIKAYKVALENYIIIKDNEAYEEFLKEMEDCL